MHIELSPRYTEGLQNVISNVVPEAHLTNSFNASGETIIMAISKEDLLKIIEATEEDFKNKDGEGPSAAVIEGLKAILREQLK